MIAVVVVGDVFGIRVVVDARDTVVFVSEVLNPSDTFEVNVRIMRDGIEAVAIPFPVFERSLVQIGRGVINLLDFLLGRINASFVCFLARSEGCYQKESQHDAQGFEGFHDFFFLFDINVDGTKITQFYQP